MDELNREVAQYFPYAEVRPHQDEFIRTIFEAVEDGRSVLIEGSNGLGKTIAALSACLPKAVDKGFKILYVARTHRQHERVIEELKAISRKQQVSGVSVRGRHEMCLNDLVTGHDFDARAVMEVCDLLKAKDRCQYYSNIEKRQGEYSDIQQQINLHPCTASEIRRVCRRRGFCPYELVKSSLAETNVIALSYLYVFDPVIRGPLLRSLETLLSRIILIIDEAHNLPETAVDIASSRLSFFAIKQAEIEAKKFEHKDIAKFAKVAREELETMATQIAKEERILPESLKGNSRESWHNRTPNLFRAHA